MEKLDRYEEALVAYNKALKLDPENFSFLFSRARMLKKLRRYEEANADYDRAELLAPTSPLAAICIKASVDVGEEVQRERAGEQVVLQNKQSTPK